MVAVGAPPPGDENPAVCPWLPLSIAMGRGPGVGGAPLDDEEGDSLMKTRRLTTAQAIVAFLKQQYVERDGVEQRFFAGCWGIFGHGNVAGIGQALAQYPESLRYHQARNEQSMVHIAAGYARMKDRLSTFACTTSIGPGATNLVTGAALATVNRIPVL